MQPATSDSSLAPGKSESCCSTSAGTRDGPHVFENPSTGRAILALKRGYASAVREAGISDLTFHDLRHTWSTRAEELGVPEVVRRDILGHTPGTMTASYTRVKKSTPPADPPRQLILT